MKYLLIGSILLLGKLHVCSQEVNYFNKLNPVNVDFSEHLFTYQDGVQHGAYYYCLGSRLTPTNRQHTLTKLNQQGDTVWNKYYGDAPHVFLGLRLISYASQLVAVGITKNSTDNTTEYDVHLQAFDHDGNVLWENRIEHPFEEMVYDVVKSEDGKLTIAGNTRSFGNAGQLSNGSSVNFYFLQVDSLGNVLWENYMDLPYLENCIGITELSGGGFVMSGTGRRANDRNDILLVYTDEHGNIIRNQYYGTYYGNESGGKIMELPDKTLLLTSSYIDSSYNIIPRIYKLGIDGSVYWHQDYPDQGFSRFDLFRILEEDGSVILGGYYKNQYNNELSKIIRIAPDGELVYTRKYNSDLPEIPQYIVGASKVDDGYLLLGTTFDTNFVQRAWAIKTDCFLCDSTLCYFEDAGCYYYDCTQAPTNAAFSLSQSTVDLSAEQEISFLNTSANCTSRSWDLGDGTHIYRDSAFTHQYESSGDYEVLLITRNGACSDTSKQIIHVLDTSLGLDDKPDPGSGFRIYPNPSEGSFRILLPQTSEKYRVCVLDNTGRSVATFEGTDNTPQLEELPAGNYFVHVYLGDRFLGIRQAVIVH